MEPLLNVAFILFGSDLCVTKRDELSDKVDFVKLFMC